MVRGREGRVYRVKNIPVHLDRQGTGDLLHRIVPYLGPRENVTIFSLAKDRQDSLTATVTFKSLPSPFDNDREEWTFHAAGIMRSIIFDVHFLDFTVLNEPSENLHTMDCVAISGLASHAFGSWKQKDPSSDFMWLRDGLRKDVPQLRNLTYGYDTQLSGSQSFQNLDHIASTFITRLKTFGRTLPATRPLILLAHSLGGIVLKRALVMLADQSGDDGKTILQSVKGIVFFGVPSKGMKIEHLLAMVEGQPNEDLIRGVLAPESDLLPELDESFCSLFLQLDQILMSIHETKRSLTTRYENGTWRRSEPYEILVNQDSATQRGTAAPRVIAVEKDHSNMVKFGENDPTYQTVAAFLSDISKNTGVPAPNTLLMGTIDHSPLISLHRRTRVFSTVPFSKDPGFIGREDILKQLDSKFAKSKSEVWASLYGLGGIGKSQIAIEYSYRVKKQSPQASTFWVHASSKARFEQSYVEIATKAGILGTGDSKVDILQLVSDWLENRANGPWLLILDNADDATVLLDRPKSDTDIGPTSVQRRLLDFVPRVQHGAVLITSRDRTCVLGLTGHRGTPIEVLEMNLEESVNLLRNILPEALQEEASELVKELENIPLAISQASAYIKAVTMISIPKYLKLFRRDNEDQAALLNQNKEDLRRDSGVPNAVITSWQLSFNQIRKNNPASADLLSLMSYFNRQAIPGFLVKGDADEIFFYDHINVLLSFSLIRAEIEEDTFEIHRLVQTAMQHWLRSEGCDQLWKERAIDRLACHFPWNDQEAQWPACEALMSHVDEVICHKGGSKEAQLSLAEILVRTAWYLVERRGHAGLAEQRSRQALEIQRQYFGDSSEVISLTLQTLAAAYNELSKFEEAKQLQESILEQALKTLGQEHRETLIYKHSLALSCLNLGQLQRSEDLLRPVVEVGERVSGPENQIYLVYGKTLAECYLRQGKYEAAEKLISKILEISKRCYGIEHISTLGAMETLSLAHRDLQNFEEAENLISEAIPLFTKVFGPIHLRTLGTRSILAKIYYRRNKLDEAKEICMSCLDTAQETYGPQNMTTLVISNLLALIYQKQGNLTDASRLLKDVAEADRKVFGADHPNTLAFLNNLAVCYYDMGDKNHAIRLMTDVLDRKRKVFPEDHPGTADSAGWLMDWRSEVEGGEEEESERDGSEEEGSEEEGFEEEGSEDGGSENEGSEDEGSEDEGIEEDGSEEDGSEEEESEEERSKDEESDQDDEIAEEIVEVHASLPATQGAEPRPSSRKRRRIEY